MDERAATAAAELLWSAWFEGPRLDALPSELRPRDVEEGYAIQAALAALIGPTAGWKLAATSPAARASMGIDAPVAGRLFERFRLEAPAELPADGLVMGVAEAEFAFVLGRDLPPRAAAYAIDEVAGAVAALHLAVEVPDSRFRDYRVVGAAQLAADSALAGSFVLGPRIEAWEQLDLAGHAVSISANGVALATGSGANVMSGPLEALAWLASHLRHEGLRAGEVVLTGSCTVPAAIAAGDQLVADFGALGRVDVSFGARVRA